MPLTPGRSSPAPRWNPPSFICGANLPWLLYGCDFGSSAWYPDGGVSRPEQAARLDDVLERLGQSGITALRWFALCDLRSGVRFTADGTPRELDPFVNADFEVALDALGKRGLKVILSLFDFHLCGRRRVNRGVQMGGRRTLLTDATRRTALLDNVVRPLLERFGDANPVLAWEVMNEPEWVTSGYGRAILGVRVSRQDMRAFLRAVIDVIHESSARPATVGCASRRWLSLVEDLDLDLHQVHWYDKVDSIDALNNPVIDWAAGVPALLGEFPTRGSAHGASALARAARDAGFDGAFAWSALSADEASDGDVVAALYHDFDSPSSAYRVV